MAVELASIFGGGNQGFDPGVPAMRAFSQIAEVNLARQKLRQNEEFKIIDTNLKRQELALTSEGKTALALGRELRNVQLGEALADHNIATREELDFTKQKAAKFQTGVGSLFSRLNSADETIRKEAAEEYLELRDTYGSSKSRQVQKELEEMQQTLGAREREQRMAENAAKAQTGREADDKRGDQYLNLAKDRNDRAKKQAETDRQFKIAQAKISELQKKRALKVSEKNAATKALRMAEAKALQAEVEAIDSTIKTLQSSAPATAEIVEPVSAAEQDGVLPPLLGEDQVLARKENPNQIAARVKAAGGTKEDLRKALRDAGYPTN